MQVLDAVAGVEAPPERVWQVVSDLAAYAHWNPFIVRAGGEVALGSRLTVAAAIKARAEGGGA